MNKTFPLFIFFLPFYHVPDTEVLTNRNILHPPDIPWSRRAQGCKNETSSTFMMNKPCGMQYVREVACLWGMKRAHMLVRKPEWKRLLGRQSGWRDDNIKVNLKEAGYGGYWLDLTGTGDRSFPLTPPSEPGNEVSDSLKGWELIDQMGHYQLTKKGFAACINYLSNFFLFIWKWNNKNLIDFFKIYLLILFLLLFACLVELLK